MSIGRSIVFVPGALEDHRAFVHVRDPLNFFEIEGVIGLPPKALERRPGTIFTVAHCRRSLRKDGTKMASSAIVSPVFKTFDDLAKKVLRLEVGTYVVVSGQFGSGYKALPNALSIEVIEDPSTRLKFDEETALTVALQDRVLGDA